MAGKGREGQGRAGVFLYVTTSKPALEPTHLPIQRDTGGRGLFPTVK